MSESEGTVYVVDDEPGMVKALTRLLSLEGFTARGFTSAEAFLDSLGPGEFACLLLDVSMPNCSGLELQRRLKRDGVHLPIIFLTARGDIPMSVRAMKEGAFDFLTKPVEDAALINAVRAGLRRAAAASGDTRALAEWRERYQRLTPREREVMALVVEGRLNKQIAGALGTAEQTIKIHRGRVMRKMDVESVAELVRISDRLGLVETRETPPSPPR